MWFLIQLCDICLPYCFLKHLFIPFIWPIILRSQKLLDMRLQQLQSNHKETNRLQDDVEFIRRLMAENQKALCNVVQALANIQGEIVNLVQCLKPQPKTKPNSISSQGSLPNAHHQSNAVTITPAGGTVLVERETEAEGFARIGSRKERDRRGSADRNSRRNSRKRSGIEDDESNLWYFYPSVWVFKVEFALVKCMYWFLSQHDLSDISTIPCLRSFSFYIMMRVKQYISTVISHKPESN